MEEIKRVLWVDDRPNSKVSSMFQGFETRKVSTMDEAMRIIAGEHLYDYDTIVLDIDFENGLPNGEKDILNKLDGKIYLSKDQQNRKFIINNGGYLLFLYLLEKGYPSDRVAFLTGNGGIVEQLKKYTKMNIEQLSKEEIADRFITEWEKCGDDIEEFQEIIDHLAIDKNYKDDDFVLDCVDAIDEGDIEKLRNYIEEVRPTLVTGSPDTQNTGDMMIFRFHEANIEPPIYFSKNDNDIEGHNISDAEEWIKSKRTDDNVTRWLLLDAANYIEQLFRNDNKGMNKQLGLMFKIKDGDPGIRSAYRQMYFVFDGLRNIERRGIYYQAIAAMLIPFDKVLNLGNSAEKDRTYENIQKMFSWVSKQTRNYCAHNYFGSSMSNSTVLYVIANTMLAVLTKKQVNDKMTWFEQMYNNIVSGIEYSISKNNIKIESLCENLLERNRIHRNAKVSENCREYNAKNYLSALGWNIEMSVDRQKSSEIRENYFVFTLAAYVVKWFGGMSESDVEKLYGRGVEIIYIVSNEIVSSYNYDFQNKRKMIFVDEIIE